MTVLLLYSKKAFPDNVSKNHHLFVKPRNPEATTADILDPLCSTAQVKQPTRHLLSSLHQPRAQWSFPTFMFLCFALVYGLCCCELQVFAHAMQDSGGSQTGRTSGREEAPFLIWPGYKWIQELSCWTWPSSLAFAFWQQLERFSTGAQEFGCCSHSHPFYLPNSHNHWVRPIKSIDPL